MHTSATTTVLPDVQEPRAKAATAPNRVQRATNLASPTVGMRAQSAATPPKAGAQLDPATLQAARTLADWLSPRVPKNSVAGTSAKTAFVQRYFDRPDLFVQECIKFKQGRHPYKYQLRALMTIAQNQRVSMRGPRGLGKTTCMSWIILWFALTRDIAGMDWKIPTTASVDRQLTQFLWPEIHKWARLIDWSRVPRKPFNNDELMNNTLKLDHGTAFKVVSNDPEKIEGAHADELLYIFDESKAIITEVFDALEGAFSVGNVRVIAMSTPGAPTGRFYEINTRSRGYEDWVSLNVKAQEIIDEGNKIFEQWREQRRKQWGERSAVFISQCEGEFAADDADTVIPHAWIQAAVERWYILAANYGDGRSIDCARLIEDYPFTGLSVDVGMGNENSARSVHALRFGDVIPEIRSYPHDDTMTTTGRAKALFDKWSTWLGVLPHGKLIVDANGIGAGVLHRLKEMMPNALVDGFMAQESTDAKDVSGELGFVNLRSYAWWHLRERLDPAGDPTIALPPDNDLLTDLVAPKYKVTSTGKIQVESKETIMPRIGRSTDFGDAVVQAIAMGVTSRKIHVMWV